MIKLRKCKPDNCFYTHFGNGTTKVRKYYKGASAKASNHKFLHKTINKRVGLELRSESTKERQLRESKNKSLQLARENKLSAFKRDLYNVLEKHGASLFFDYSGDTYDIYDEAVRVEFKNDEKTQTICDGWSI